MMRIARRYVAVACLALGVGAGQFHSSVLSKVGSALPDGGPPTVTYRVPAGADQHARFLKADHLAPLIVDLHQWSGDQTRFNGDDERFDLAVKRAGWNFIRPNMEGPNNNPRACCSREVLQEIKSAIDYSRSHSPVDDRAIYIVGESGGAYTALCAYMSGAISARAFFSWAAITDLAQWRREHPLDKYGADVDACTGSTAAKLNLTECFKRSPLTMGRGQPRTSLWMFAGVHDGSTGSVRTTGSVPFTHSINLFNRLASIDNVPERAVTPQEVLQLTEDRTGPDTGRNLHIGGRAVHLLRSVGLTHLVIFEGEHEMLSAPTIKMIAADYRRLQDASVKSSRPS